MEGVARLVVAGIRIRDPAAPRDVERVRAGNAPEFDDVVDYRVVAEQVGAERELVGIGVVQVAWQRVDTQS
jgi:hypothetical protein